ncbi:ligand-gated channel [Azorhizobium oxalatiphilum]|uniref:Ligand-gated channel n=2 Tax=Azorhizobium oxalatiphilum TaxID=980631 RepID=A0A917BND8_9HYPH|nr:ligand-gated channel [Azorhizobium oxalatiphilum]
MAAPAAAQEAAGAISLDTVSVDAPAGNQGFVIEQSRSAMKTDTPLIETPQSVSVISRDQMVITGARSLGEATRYTAGVRELMGGADPRYDQYQIRGFNASTTGVYLDGMQMLASSGLPFRLDTYGLERIDVLRGPSSVLYGGTNPGGLINAITKKPTEYAFGEITAGVNSFGNAYTGIDIGGPLAKAAPEAGGGEWLYRLTAVGKLGPTQTDFSEDDRAYVAPAFTWKSGTGTTFTVLGSYQKDKTTGVPFLPYVGTAVNAPWGKIPTDFVTSGKNEGGMFNGVERTQAMIGYQFEHRFDNGLTFRSNARYSHGENELFSIIGSGYVGNNPASARLNRMGFYANPIVDLFTIDNQLEGHFATGAVQHTAIVGLDYKHARFDDTQRTGAASPISIFFPNYNQPFNGLTTLGISSLSKQDQVGVYVQDQMKLERLSFVVGGRYDSVQTSVDNYLNAALSDSASEGAFSGRVGAIYELPFGFAPYVSYSTSFQPLVGINSATQQLLKPEEGEQYEVGLKFQPTGWDAFVTASLFDITRSNFLVVNPANPLQSMQSGEARSRGFEIEAVATLAKGLNLIASYTGFNIENTENLNPALIGLAPQNTPEHYASTFLDYTIQTGAFAGLGAGFGVRFMGSSWADALNTVAIPSYTLADAALHYEKNNWRAAVNVSNLMDDVFVAQCSSTSQCFYGERRKVTGSLTYRW